MGGPLGRPWGGDEQALDDGAFPQIAIDKGVKHATPIKMPRLGESVAEGTIGSWLKNEGDWAERDEFLAEIITDKINAELHPLWQGA